MTIAQSIYKNSTKFFDAQATRLMRQVQVDSMTVAFQATGLFVPHPSFVNYLKLLPTVFIHLAKLIKNIVLLAGTLVLCLLAVFGDRKISAKLAWAMAFETFLIFANITNIVLALISLFTSGLASLSQLVSIDHGSDTDSVDSDNADFVYNREAFAYDGIFPRASLIVHELAVAENVEFDAFCDNISDTARQMCFGH